MKKLTFVKETIIYASVVALILLFASCSFNQNSEDTKDVAEEQNDERFDNDEQENEAQFLVTAAEINLEQIQLAKLAQKNGRTAQVKELGKKMEDVHTKSQNDLITLAKSKMITLPTSPTDDSKDAFEDLNEKSGNDFDEAYADMMVNSHENAIETFENASTNNYDTDIKNWAIAALPGLRTHLNLSIDFQKKFDTMYLDKNN